MKWLSLLVLFLVTGCGVLGPAEDAPIDETGLVVEIRLAEVVSGEAAVMAATIQNHSPHAVYLDACRYRLYIEDQGYWVGWREDQSCKIAQSQTRNPDPFTRIAPGRTHVDTFAVSRNATLSYRYRYQYYLTDPEGDLLPLEQTQTPAFVVESQDGA